MLIRTKWIPPRSNFQLVPRPILLAKLNDAAEGKLTLICAPAGFGKTILVTDWLAQSKRPYAWLSLDTNDDDLTLFVAYLMGAVESICPDAWPTITPMLQRPDMPGADELAVALINDIGGIPDSFVLVLDDYHLIHSPDIHDLMRSVVERLPANAHIVLISRTDPPLPMPRLVVRGQATNLRVDDLRFTGSEAAEFLEINGHRQENSTVVSELNRWLEGWVAGLRMVSLSLDSVVEEASYLESLPSESDSFMAEYLLSEVLDHVSDDVRAFLLQTSILERFSTALCDVVVDETLRGKSALILDYLLRANVFIVPLDDRGEWFRYHHLFQKILQQKLKEGTDRRRMAELYQNALQWFASHDLSEEALQCALLANDFDAAVALVEARSRNMLNGLERRTLERWMEMLPAEVVWQRPRLLLARAWLLYRHWRLQALDDVLRALAERLDEASDEVFVDEELVERRFIYGQMNALKSATLFHLHFDFQTAISTAELAIKNLPPTEGGALGTAVISSAFSKIGCDEGPMAISELNHALRDPSPFGAAAAQISLGLWASHYMMGDLTSLGEDLGQVGAFGDAPLTNRAAANWFAGLMTYEQDRLAQAQHHLTIMYKSRHELNFLGGFFSGYPLVRIHQILNETAEAQILIDSLHSELVRIGNQEFLRQLDGLQAYQWLLTDELDLAARWAKNYRPENSPDSLIFVDPPGLVWIRVVLVAGRQADLGTVLSYLKAKLLQLDGSQFYRRQLQLHAHQAAVHACMGNMAAADVSLLNALRLGQSGEHIRSFADVGSHLLPVLRRLTEDDVNAAYKQKIMAAIQEKRSAPTIATVTLLTSRQREILQKMNYGHTNQEIATELTISVHTVKRHVSNIFDKLGVNNRRQAIYRATELDILSNGQDESST